MVIFFSQLKKVFRLLNRENVPKIFLLIILSVALGTFGIYIFEYKINQNVGGVLDAIWWSLVTITTVGYGDISPVTLGGRITAVIVMILGIGFVGMFTATIASIFVERKLKEERGLMKTNATGHTILCGWNFQAEDIIQEIRADKETRNQFIVLIADIDSKPIDDTDLFFIKGDVNEDTLQKANLEEARNIIIIGDDRLDPRSRDARTILNTLTVESINPDVYTCVEIENSENVAHCRRAKADEIIVSGEFSSKLLARAAIHHGISKLIDELVSSRYGADLYKIEAPKRWVGIKFIDAFTQAKIDFDAIIVAIDSAAKKAFLSNPEKNYVIQSGDSLILISTKKPDFV